MRIFARVALNGSFVLIFLVHLASQNPSASGKTANTYRQGIVVETVARYSASEKAGLADGDILLRWRRGDARGIIQSPFDLLTVEIEQAPRGEVTIEGRRGADEHSWTLGQDAWGIRTRPNFSEALVDQYREGVELASAGKLNDASEKWQALASRTGDQVPEWQRSWLWFHIAELHAQAREWKEADEAYDNAIQSMPATEAATTAQIERQWAATFLRRSDWDRAEKHYLLAMATAKDTTTDSMTRALDLNSFATLFHKRGDLPKADRYYQQALGIREKLAPESLAVAASLNNLGKLEYDRSGFDKAQDYEQRALAISQKLAPAGLSMAETLGNVGDVAFNRGNLDQAEKNYRRSFEILVRLTPGDLDQAMACTRLGWIALARNDLPAAEKYHQQALEIRERLAPGSLEAAQSLNNLGNASRGRGDLAQAEAFYMRALTIWEKLAPGSLDLAAGFNNLGLVALQRGDLARAEAYYLQASPIVQNLAPGSLDVAVNFNNLGVVAWQRGDLAKAETFLMQALPIMQKLVPGSVGVSTNLNNLGKIAWQRGDLVKAESYHQEALAIRQRQAPRGLDVALSLEGLTVVALDLGNLKKAEELSRDSFAIYQKLAPHSLGLARAYNYLGWVAYEQKDLARAEDCYQQALIIQEQLAPGSMDMALTLNRLGRVVESGGDFGLAEHWYRKAISIWEKLAPGSASYAEALSGLASVMVHRHEFDAAGRFYQRSLDTLEQQSLRLGGTDDIRAGFRAKYNSYYQEYASLLMVQGETGLAFQVLERSRARTLMEMLASNHLQIRHGADPALLQSERSLREDIAAKTDRRVRLLTDKGNEEQVAEIEGELNNLRNRYQAVEAGIRTTSPAYAALTQPQSLTAVQIQRLLDPNTALLEYALGEKRSYVFALTADSIAAYELPKRAEIEDLARKVYALLTGRNHAARRESPLERQVRLSHAEAAYNILSAKLTRMVLAPVASVIRGKRILIVSDGALHYIPFAALPEPANHADHAAPLMLSHEVVNLPSASVLAALRSQEADRKPAVKIVAVIADPVFSPRDERVPGTVERPRVLNSPVSIPNSSAPDDEALTRSARDVGVELTRLPYTRREADAIVSLAHTMTMEALDFKATRTAAISSDLSQYRIVHFATHGLLDSRHPELSGLVFSLVDKEGRPQSGFLGLEDIYNLNLPADLVVLSACETGLGKEIKGEGLIGLTRGFMYAGASRVVASLWKVNDLATAELMKYFYAGVLRDHLPPAAALRRAQVQMWKQTRWRSPYYWAAFQIQGDWN